MHENWNDETLMLAFGGGDGKAFEALYRRHGPRVYRYLRYMAGQREAVDMIYRRVWTAVLEPRAVFDGSVPFAAWLYSAAHGMLMDHFSDLAPGVVESFLHDDLSDDDLLDIAGSSETLVGADPEELADHLPDALEMLPPAEREVYLLQEEAGLSPQQIAVVCGVGVPAVQARLIRAVGGLREQLGALM